MSFSFIQLWIYYRYIKNWLFCASRNASMVFYLQHLSCNSKTLIWTTYFKLLHFNTGMQHHKLDKTNRVSWLKEPAFFLFVLGFIGWNYKTRKLSLLPCMYRYTFSFTLKLTATLLWKLATFWWNGPKHTPLLLWSLGDYRSAKLNKKNMFAWFFIPTMSYCFQRFVNILIFYGIAWGSSICLD